LEALSSAELEKLRAASGAGLPVTQRFYEFYGERGVSGAPYLRWWDVQMPGGDKQVPIREGKRFNEPILFDRTNFFPNDNNNFNPVSFFADTRSLLRKLITDAATHDAKKGAYGVDDYSGEILSFYNK
jgi:hypothetical protein